MGSPVGHTQRTRTEEHSAILAQAPEASSSRPRRREHSGDADEVALARIVTRAQAGERDALAELYDRYWRQVYGYVRGIVRDEHEAEDVTQQVFMKLMVAISRYQRGSVPFIAWLLRVARNVAIDHLRQRRPIPSGEPWAGAAPQSDADTLCGPEVREAMASLGGEQRRVVVLRHIVGLSPPEIAARIGKSESSVHGLHHRGREALKCRLAECDLTPVTARAA